MGLYTSCSDANKVTDEATITVKVSTLCKAAGHWFWQSETIDKGSWRYVGLTEAAATAAAQGFIWTYTETVSRPKVTIAETTLEATVSYATTEECVADVKAYHVEGKIWEVSVALRRPAYTWTLIA